MSEKMENADMRNLYVGKNEKYGYVKFGWTIAVKLENSQEVSSYKFVAPAVGLYLEGVCSAEKKLGKYYNTTNI